jgi:hypothetical protein
MDLVAVDSNADAMRTYHANLPFAEVHAEGLDKVLFATMSHCITLTAVLQLLADIQGRDAPRWTDRFKNGGLDILILTPPCQVGWIPNTGCARPDLAQAFGGANRSRSLADHRAALVSPGLDFSVQAESQR